MLKKGNCLLTHFCCMPYIVLGTSFHLCLVCRHLLVIPARNTSYSSVYQTQDLTFFYLYTHLNWQVMHLMQFGVTHIKCTFLLVSHLLELTGGPPTPPPIQFSVTYTRPNFSFTLIELAGGAPHTVQCNTHKMYLSSCFILT